MRLMMQSLLADRFLLSVHFETQTVPALALLLVKPGKLGPQLRPHSEGPACPAEPGTPNFVPENVKGVFPQILRHGASSEWHARFGSEKYHHRVAREHDSCSGRALRKCNQASS